MLETLSWITIALCGLYFVGLGVACFAAPERTTGFLQAFASSAGKHFAELGIRIILGIAFFLQAPQLPLPDIFRGFGLILIITSVILGCIPWRLHYRFAQWSAPLVTRRLWLFGLASMALGVGILLALLSG